MIMRIKNNDVKVMLVKEGKLIHSHTAEDWETVKSICSDCKAIANKYDAPDSAFEVRFTDYDHCITEYYTINGNKKK